MLPGPSCFGRAQPLSSHEHFRWPLARGLTVKLVASITGYSAYWIGRIAQRYDGHEPDTVSRHTAVECRAHRVSSRMGRCDRRPAMV